jgi:hypothetical protein
MQAEEYDLSLRLLAANWEVRAFPDLHVTHLKTPGARYPSRVTRFDVRNNLIIIARHFPRKWARLFALDWIWRYWLIASTKGHRLAFCRGILEALLRLPRQSHRHLLDEPTFERFAKILQTRQRMGIAKKQHALRRVLFVDLGKNVFAYYLAAKRCNLHIVAIADGPLAGHTYRGIPILDPASACKLTYDAAIVSNLSPVHAQARHAAWRTADARPVIDLFNDPAIDQALATSTCAVQEPAAAHRTAARSA